MTIANLCPIAALLPEQNMWGYVMSSRHADIGVVQKALKVVASWPWYPDTLGMSNALAAKYEAPTARSLLGITSIPPLLPPNFESADQSLSADHP